jgi:hypothetical protein
MKQLDPNKVRIAVDGLPILAEVVNALAEVDQTPDMSKLALNSLSGDLIQGGTITKFTSTGIKDESSRLVVFVNDDGIVTDTIDVETLIGETNVSGDLKVDGEIYAKKLHVDEVTADVRNERSGPLEFNDADGNIYNKGLLWVQKEGPTKQLVYRPNPDRLWSSDAIDLHADAAYLVNGNYVLNKDSLGPDVKTSSLKQLGILNELTVKGNMSLSQHLFWNADADRLGLGTDAPNGAIGVMGFDSEFVVDVDQPEVRIGTYTTHDLEIITDDTPRITLSANGKVHFGTKGGDSARVTVHGKLGVGVNQVADDTSFAVAGPIRFENKKFQVGEGTPTEGQYRKGDIVWNDDPKPTSYIGWVCIREGTPGEWKPFGQISS